MATIIIVFIYVIFNYSANPEHSVIKTVNPFPFTTHTCPLNYLIDPFSDNLCVRSGADHRWPIFQSKVFPVKELNLSDGRRQRSYAEDVRNTVRRGKPS